MGIIEKFNDGGFFMWVILLGAVTTITLLIERFYVLYIQLKPLKVKTLNEIKQAIASGDIKKAETLAEESSGVYLDAALLAIKLRQQGVADDELFARVDEGVSYLVQKIDKRTGFLAVIGNVSTLVGLLGTISGMITSFASVSNASTAERAAMLSKGISEAMNCTAFGLIVAIPALVGYAVFQNRTESVVHEVSGIATRIFNDLIYRYEPIKVKRASKSVKMTQAPTEA